MNVTLKQYESARRRRSLRLEYLPAFLKLLEAILGHEIHSARDVFDGTKHTLQAWIETTAVSLATGA